MDMKNIIVEKENQIATVTINRPKALNALNMDPLLEIVCCFQELAEDQDTKVVIITGAGEKSFVEPSRFMEETASSAEKSSVSGCPIALRARAFSPASIAGLPGRR